jgi:uncharacterized protein (TIGR03435 family)
MRVGRLLIGFLVCVCADSQSSAPLAFEVASFKLAQPGARPVSLASDPGRWMCSNCSLFALLTQAFEVFEYQVEAPEWTKVAMFDVAGKLPEGAKREEVRPMLQALLEERLKMKAHRESREMPVYELVIAKGGPKLQEVTEPAAAPPPGPAVDGDGYPNIPGANGMRFLNGRGRIQFRGQTMKNIAHYISGQVDRPVLDATELKGKYAVKLSFRQLPRDANGISTGGPGNEEFGPTIYEAVEDQLGLKLKPARRSVEMIIVDRVEKTPTEN